MVGVWGHARILTAGAGMQPTTADTPDALLGKNSSHGQEYRELKRPASQ